jgi:tRNA threonylcarbamoyladenosine biosynthesis protein TsaB
VRTASEAPARIVGSAARLIAERLTGAAERPVCIDQTDAVDIAWVARMGAVLPQAQSPPKPQYLRAADAQPQTAARLPRR